MKRVELLSPAGGYETMVGAFNAGADAVYLGGSKFGARAYADNFDRDQVLDAISYAHLHDKKIYMTVNTLVKENEYGELYDFMLPYADRGLDGVIVQDLGVIRLIRQEFPGIELHASTQQTVTGVYGAKLLKERGCTRVVPARELSLSEMKAIRDEADIEVEAFIHGAMCYCYSGICLFSSVVGGRSGNRGRCAQPCRLPYRMNGKSGEQYPLSLKDMSTIAIIPELIEAGIDSFKIEGRMKKPEYSAGVTALYRKYIDKYYENPKGDHSVSKEDMEILRNLYQRTGISDGYYHRHNDKSMVTIISPAYNPTSDEILSEVHEKFLTSELKLKCDIFCELRVGEAAKIAMSLPFGDDVVYEECTGSVVQAASKRPLEEENVRKQLLKLGGTPFECENIEITIDDKGSGNGIFIAVSELNELRRTLVAKVIERLYEIKKSAQKINSYENVRHFTDLDSYKSADTKRGPLHVLCNTKEQLVTVLDRAENNTDIGRIYVDSNVFLSADVKELSTNIPDMEMFVALPYVTRQEDFDGSEEVQRVLDKLPESGYTGVLVRNLEQLGFLCDKGFTGKAVSDYSVYTWNKEAAMELIDCNKQGGFRLEEVSVPYELNFGEARDMAGELKKTVDIPVSYNLYGHMPMMVSAGCIKKTTDRCSGRVHELYTENTTIIDRLGNVLPVTCNCRHCYNVIWNVHPTSLHGRMGKIMNEKSFDHYRIDFTVESAKRCGEVLDYYTDLYNGADAADIFESGSFTTGHFKRGAE
ncbi:peptidase U32 family protein [Butyrivibrio sp. VCB2001]|uniref:peptidase U32 family protein n=1 Tax=Butyrivibrio sp. VCB2001 TaxID=1280667 RepID=UPI0003FFFEAB|nr:U32 family peptidase [Butyrivibrio sp. VCB2001]